MRLYHAVSKILSIWKGTRLTCMNCDMTNPIVRMIVLSSYVQRRFVTFCKFRKAWRKTLFPQRYEALKMRGTEKQLEEVTGLKANCTPVVGKGVVDHKRVDPEYICWMNKYHDWDTEALIGYFLRDPFNQEDFPLTPKQLNLTFSLRQSNAQFK